MHPVQRANYPEHSREELVGLLPPATSVLDVGCASGGWARTLRRHLGPDVTLVGIEAMASEVEAAKRAGFDEVHCGYFPDDMPTTSRRFDLITFNDVLEHTIDPWSVLSAAHQFLTPGGHVLASLPSIQFAPVVLQLLRGRWDYQDDGILDRTHLRFFTKATMIELFESAEFEVTHVQGINPVGQSRETTRATTAAWRAARRLMGNAQYSQFALIGSSVRPAPAVAPS